jgi:hypothetical protein
MFNPSITFELKALWDYTSSFYNMMYDSDREVIEDYWTALLEGVRGLHYDLYQYNLLKALDYSRGFIENVHKYYDIYLEDGYAEERGRLENKVIKVHVFNSVLYALTQNHIYQSTDLEHWEEITLNLTSSTFTCLDIDSDGGFLYLLLSNGIYRKEEAIWTTVFSVELFTKLATYDAQLAVKTTTNKVFLGQLNYLTEYAFTDLSARPNYTYTGSTIYALNWVNGLLYVGTDDGLHVYDPSLVQVDGSYGEWLSIDSTNAPSNCVTLNYDPTPEAIGETVQNYPTGIRITGSSGLGDEAIRTEVLRICEEFDYILITNYGYFTTYFAGTDLESKCIPYMSLWSRSTYSGTGFQRGPSEVGDSSILIYYDAGHGYYTYGYVVDDQRFIDFKEDIADLIDTYNIAGIMCDDHRNSHTWWEGADPGDDPGDIINYNLVHAFAPAEYDIKLEQLEDDINDIMVSGAANQYSWFNGPIYTSNSYIRRLWEAPGVFYSASWDFIESDALENDYLQCTVQDEETYQLACYYGKNRGCIVNLGFNDSHGNFVLDGEDHLDILYPEDYYYLTTSSETLTSGIYVGSDEGLYRYTISGSWEVITSDIITSGEGSVDAVSVYGSGIITSTTDGVFYAENVSGEFTSLSATLDSSQPLTLDTLSSSLFAGTIDGVYKTAVGTDAWTKFDAGYYYYELPGDDLYLSIPILSGEVTGQILTEGTDYELYEMRYIKFLDEFETSDAEVLNGERFLSPNDLVLAPTLKNIFLPGFGETSPSSLIENGEYPPYLSGVDEDTLSNYEYKQYYADHLMKWTHALSAKLRHPPTVSNLTDIYGYIKGLPFAYEDSWFHSSWSGIDNEVYAKFVTSGSTDYITYEIPYPLEYYEYDYGDYVGKYDLIGSGINVVDYVKDLTLISGMLEENGDEITTLTIKNLLFLQETNRLYLSGVKEKNNDNIIDKFVNEIAPLGLTKLVGNREPQVSMDTDLVIHEANNVAIEVPITVVDAEDDILTYKLRYLSPTAEYLTDEFLTVTTQGSQTETPTFIPDQIPPVDTSYRFTVEVDDIYHTVETATRNFVAGDVPFIQWGQPDYGFDDEFALGDVDIEYLYLSGIAASGIEINFNLPFWLTDATHYPKDFALFKDDESLYHVYFIDHDAIGGHGDVHDEPYLGHISSPDLRTWEQQSNILLCAEGGAWENQYVWAPYVMRNPFNSTSGHTLENVGKYLMYYTGVLTPYYIQKMGLAFSDDGDTWTRYSGNPIAFPDHYDGVNDEYWAHFDVSQNWKSNFRDPHITGPVSVGGVDTWYCVNSCNAYQDGSDKYGALSLMSSTDLVTWTDIGYPFVTREGDPDNDNAIPESAQLLYKNDQWYLFITDTHTEEDEPYNTNQVTYTTNDTLVEQWSLPTATLQLREAYNPEFAKAIEFLDDSSTGSPTIMATQRTVDSTGTDRGMITFHGVDFSSGDPYTLTKWSNNNDASLAYYDDNIGIENLVSLNSSGLLSTDISWTVYDYDLARNSFEFDTLVSGVNPQNEGEYRVEPDGSDWEDVTTIKFYNEDTRGSDVVTDFAIGPDVYGVVALDYDDKDDTFVFSSRSFETDYVEFAVLSFQDIDLTGAPADKEILTVELTSTLNNAFALQPTVGDGPADRSDPSSNMTGNAYIATKEKHVSVYEDNTSDTYGKGKTWGYGEGVGYIKSSNFTITKNRMSLMVGGGNDSDTEFVALVDATTDQIIFKETGEDSDVMSFRLWDTTTLRGRSVYFVISDLGVTDWSCISCDAIHEYTETDPDNDPITPDSPNIKSGAVYLFDAVDPPDAY